MSLSAGHGASRAALPLLASPPIYRRTAIALAALAWAAAGAASAQQAPATGSTTLATVEVTAEAGRENTTEGSGSYASPSATIGSKLPASLKDVPQSVTMITRQRIEDQNLSTLDEVMAQTPGVTVDLSGTAVVPAYYSRGFPIEYFQYDGVPLQTGGSSWTQPDMIAYDHVELLRGAAGLFNGAGQPGGVINLVRKRPMREFAFSGSLGLGSWNAKRGEADVSTPLNASGSLRARFAAAYDGRDSHVDVASSTRRSLYGVIEADLAPQTTASFGLIRQERDWVPPMMGVPRYRDGGDLGLPRSTFLSTPWSHWDFETTQVFADLSHRFNADWQLKLNTTFERETSNLKYAYVSGAVDRLTRRGPALAGGANAYENEQIGVDAMLSGAFQAFGQRHELVVGANWYDRKADARGGRLANFGGTAVDVFNFNPSAIADPGDPIWTSSSRTETRQHGVYGATRLKLADPLTLLVGARMSWWDTEGRNLLTNARTSGYKQDGRVTPYAGLVYAIDPRWSAYASYTDIFRVQSNYLQSDGTGLPPVVGANYEVGVKGELFDKRLNTSFSVFRITESNRAVQISPVATNSCCYAADGEVQSQGLEAEVSGQLAPGWQASAGYTFNTSKYKRDATYEGQSFRSFAPRHMLRLWTNYRLPDALRAWSVGGGVNLQSDIWNQGGTPAVRVAQSGYAVWNLRVGYEIDRHWSAAINVNNLFDKSYYSRLGSGGFGPTNFGNVYGEPRSVMLSLRAKY